MVATGSPPARDCSRWSANVHAGRLAATTAGNVRSYSDRETQGARGSEAAGAARRHRAHAKRAVPEGPEMSLGDSSRGQAPAQRVWPAESLFRARAVVASEHDVA